MSWSARRVLPSRRTKCRSTCVRPPTSTLKSRYWILPARAHLRSRHKERPTWSWTGSRPKRPSSAPTEFCWKVSATKPPDRWAPDTQPHPGNRYLDSAAQRPCFTRKATAWPYTSTPSGSCTIKAACGCKRLQIEHAANLITSAKLENPADKICDLRDMNQSPTVDWSTQRKTEYSTGAKQVVDPIRGVSPALEKLFDEVFAARASH